MHKTRGEGERERERERSNKKKRRVRVMAKTRKEEWKGKINRRSCTRWPINCAAQPRGYQDCYVSHSCGKLDRWKYLKARQICAMDTYANASDHPPICEKLEWKWVFVTISSIFDKYNTGEFLSFRSSILSRTRTHTYTCVWNGIRQLLSHWSLILRVRTEYNIMYWNVKLLYYTLWNNLYEATYTLLCFLPH